MRPRDIVLLLGFAALAAKLYCAATTIGSSDVVFFYQFARAIEAHGLIETYRTTPLFNHTPAVGWFSELCVHLEHGNRYLFAFLIRLPGILADLFSLFGLLWLRKKTGRPSWWALGLFAASPVAFMISGYHGNLDSVMAAGLLFAGLACAVDRPAWCGFFLGLTCNIKITPILFIPAFFFLWQRRGNPWRFALPAAATALAGWSPALISIPFIFLKNVLGYSSIWGVWGVSYLLHFTSIPALNHMVYGNAEPQLTWIIMALKAVIIGLTVLIAWRRRAVRDLDVFKTLALTWAVFFTFAPGFGSQYLIWLAPCILLSSERWYAVVTFACSISLFAFYNIISHGMPWSQGFTVHSIASQWMPWMVPAWLAIAAYLGAEGWRIMRPSREPGSESLPQTLATADSARRLLKGCEPSILLSEGAAANA